MSQLTVVPLTLREANSLVENWHRHHKSVRGHRFSLGVIDKHGIIHGACIVGRPVARQAGDPRKVLEVTRLVTNGRYNVCSMLYSASARVGRQMGFVRIQTYILEEELGTSLKASGWYCEGLTGGGTWNRENREREDKHPLQIKKRWVKILNPDFGKVEPWA